MCGRRDAPAIGPWVVRSASGADETSFDQPSEFAAALRQAMSEARDIEPLFAMWEQNVETVRALNRSLKQASLPRSGIAPSWWRATQALCSSRRSTCALWPSAPVSFTEVRRATPITSASPSLGALGSRSAMNLRSRSAPFTISRTMQPAMSGCGGRSTRLIRFPLQSACGEKASRCEHRASRG
jgi:hypothetical protein